MLNWAFGIFNVILGAFLKVLWDSLRDLQKTDEKLLERVHTVETLVIANYPRKEEMADGFKSVNETLDKIFGKLDKLVDKLEQKQDKTQ